tara:strand:- start:327 stop:527 length:201 start_codon:yes stop_codon:yes gene_type:complete
MGYKILKEVYVGPKSINVYLLNGMSEVLQIERASEAMELVNILNRNSDNNTTYKLVSCKIQDGTKV